MKRHSASEIVARLRQADALISTGVAVADAVRAVGVTAITYYRWRKKYRGLTNEQVEWMMELQTELARLRRSVADLELDKRILTEVSKTFLMSAAQRRACVDRVKFELGVSERRACAVLGQHRSTQRKIPKSAKRGLRKDIVLPPMTWS